MHGKYLFGMFIILISIILIKTGYAQSDSLDQQVEKFLESNKYHWRDMNVPEEDGKILHDLILENNYTSALEIGTSTGRSGVWMARALRKTGGTLITIEIDEERFETASQNFKSAGLAKYIVQKLGDAHKIVPGLEESFDFVFVDADKQGYTDYLKNILPKLKTGGCFTAHNVSSSYMSGIDEFLEYLKQLDYMETTIDNTSGSGLSISYKKK